MSRDVQTFTVNWVQMNVKLKAKWKFSAGFLTDVSSAVVRFSPEELLVQGQ